MALFRSHVQSYRYFQENEFIHQLASITYIELMAGFERKTSLFLTLGSVRVFCMTVRTVVPRTYVRTRTRQPFPLTSTTQTRLLLDSGFRSQRFAHTARP